jgi:hypothetical protein
VNGHQAAINIGVQGSATDVTATQTFALIRVSVPIGASSQIVSVQHGSFLEGVVFIPTTDSSKYGNVAVNFFSLRSQTAHSAGLQVTQNGTTVTSYGDTHSGLTGQFSVN